MPLRVFGEVDMAIKFPWTKTEIERTLDHEPDQAQIDGGMAWDYYTKLAQRDPVRAAKLLEKFEQEAIDQWQSK